MFIASRANREFTTDCEESVVTHRTIQKSLNDLDVHNSVPHYTRYSEYESAGLRCITINKLVELMGLPAELFRILKTLLRDSLVSRFENLNSGQIERSIFFQSQKSDTASFKLPLISHTKKLAMFSTYSQASAVHKENFQMYVVFKAKSATASIQ